MKRVISHKKTKNCQDDDNRYMMSNKRNPGIFPLQENNQIEKRY